MNIVEYFYKKGVEIEEGILLKVLSDYLKRNVEIEDAKECNRIYKVWDPFSYDFFYKQIHLGTIRHSIPSFEIDNDQGYTYTVTFTPAK